MIGSMSGNVNMGAMNGKNYNKNLQSIGITHRVLFCCGAPKSKKNVIHT